MELVRSRSIRNHVIHVNAPASGTARTVAREALDPTGPGRDCLEASSAEDSGVVNAIPWTDGLFKSVSSVAVRAPKERWFRSTSVSWAEVADEPIGDC